MFLLGKSRNYSFSVIVCALFLFFLTSLHASDSSYITQAKKLKLYEYPYWQKLTLIQNNQKRILNKNFYFSQNDHVQNILYDELIETINAYEKNPALMCKFPARYKWLNKYLKFNFEMPSNEECTKLDVFKKTYFKELSLMYTSERYNSPSSLFGHIFIKTKTNENDYAINYAAQVPDNENSFMYAYRGLSGKYNGQYFLIPFLQKVYEYNSTEFRDILEFKLNFSKEQTENLFLHLYELIAMEQEYYFISRNCSSEILHLIEMADEKYDFQNKRAYEAIPYKVIADLQQLNIASSFQKYPSRMYKFYSYVNALDESGKELLDKILNYKISVANFDQLPLENNTKYNIINAAIEYISIKSTQHDIDDKYVFPLVKLITLKHKYPLIEESKVPLKESIYSTRYNMLYAGYTHEVDESFINLGFRYLYRSRYDLMDAIQRKGSVELFNLELKKSTKNQKVEVKKFILFNLESMPESDRYFDEVTTQMSAGIDEVFTNHHKYLFVKYGKGKKYDYEYFSFLPSLDMTGYYDNEEFLSGGINLSFEKVIDNKIMIENINKYSKFSQGTEQKINQLNVHYKMNQHSKMLFSLEEKKDIDTKTNFRLNYVLFF